MREPQQCPYLEVALQPRHVLARHLLGAEAERRVDSARQRARLRARHERLRQAAADSSARLEVRCLPATCCVAAHGCVSEIRERTRRRADIRRLSHTHAAARAPLPRVPWRLSCRERAARHARARGSARRTTRSAHPAPVHSVTPLTSPSGARARAAGTSGLGTDPRSPPERHETLWVERGARHRLRAHLFRARSRRTAHPVRLHLGLARVDVAAFPNKPDRSALLHGVGRQRDGAPGLSDAHKMVNGPQRQMADQHRPPRGEADLGLKHRSSAMDSGPQTGPRQSKIGLHVPATTGRACGRGLPLPNLV